MLFRSDSHLRSGLVVERGAVQLLAVGVGHCAGRVGGDGCGLSV